MKCRCEKRIEHTSIKICFAHAERPSRIYTHTIFTYATIEFGWRAIDAVDYIQYRLYHSTYKLVAYDDDIETISSRILLIA